MSTNEHREFQLEILITAKHEVDSRRVYKQTERYNAPVCNHKTQSSIYRIYPMKISIIFRVTKSAHKPTIASDSLDCNNSITEFKKKLGELRLRSLNEKRTSYYANAQNKTENKL